MESSYSETSEAPMELCPDMSATRFFCRICNYCLKVPIMSCKRGHRVCKTCIAASTANACRECGENYCRFFRDSVFETRLRSEFIFCDFKACSIVLNPQDYHAHVAKCVHNTSFACPGFPGFENNQANGRCFSNIDMDNCLNHFQEVHKMHEIYLRNPMHLKLGQSSTTKKIIDHNSINTRLYFINHGDTYELLIIPLTKFRSFIITVVFRIQADTWSFTKTTHGLSSFLKEASFILTANEVAYFAKRGRISVHLRIEFSD